MTTSLYSTRYEEMIEQNSLNFDARWGEKRSMNTHHIRPKSACTIRRTIDDAGDCMWRLSHNGKTRRHSVSVHIVDRYAQSKQDALLFDRKAKEDIEIKEPLLGSSKPDARSDSFWLETPTSVITEKQFCEVDTPGVWFQGESIDTSLGLLEGVLGCESHRIALCNTYHAYSIWQIGRESNPDISNAPLVAKVSNKDFVVVPISDGWADWVEIGQEHEKKQVLRSKRGMKDTEIDKLYGKTSGLQSKGRHWSVMVVDVRGKTFKGRYFDSFCTEVTSHNATAAYTVLKGLRALEAHVQPEGQDGRDIELVVDKKTPHQGRDNVSGAADGGAACGPFVWAITKEILQFIVDCREDGAVVTDIALPAGFGRRWAWDSRHTRMVIRNLIERERRVRVHLNKAGRTYKWFDDGGAPGWQTWLNTNYTVASFNTLIDDVKRSFSFFKNHPLLGTDSHPPLTEDELPTDVLSKIANFLQQRGLGDVASFVTNPRLDDPAYLTTLAIVLAAAFVTMSWFSRTGGSWGGRFSPFGRQPPNAGVVNDSDFSYITNDDLRRNNGSQGPEIVEWDDKNPDRETDVLIFKEKRTNYPTHFAAHSIRDGDLKISTVRQAAAKKLGVSDPRRIRMFYKGRNLKHDERTAREEGLRGDGTGSEILITIGEMPAGGLAPGSEDVSQRAWSDGEDEEDDDESGVDSGANTTGRKKSRKRGGKKNKKKGSSATPSGTSTPGYSNAAGAGPEYLPLPSQFNAAPRPSPSPAPRAATPQTAMGKLDAIGSKFHTEFVPMCVQFMAHPPEDKSKRDFEYKKLSETILTQILMKFDGVETEGDQDARMKRKALVKEVQGMLNKLDETMKLVAGI
ncbi:hypothetical protein P153DRAFT_389291 [Dothidotthia symphoricarpi CBS 119687]|uniref:BAG domain-containing protein n=1 Tax=Dothidotthia symphoricarpi CBS 119687 TaxID=1392245 RepID=A0A6A6A4Z5_9PLEO|nr:uncharacterized protein P153DRAFT_389291 [Dothidotthia symphoricarpi CBS 119687]KAF2125838.1 hypothetical protein P153DRAFT_389291 [Dothidotthia symphoricarpi CBS 119687]